MFTYTFFLSIQEAIRNQKKKLTDNGLAVQRLQFGIYIVWKWIKLKVKSNKTKIKDLDKIANPSAEDSFQYSLYIIGCALNSSWYSSIQLVFFFFFFAAAAAAILFAILYRCVECQTKTNEKTKVSGFVDHYIIFIFFSISYQWWLVLLLLSYCFFFVPNLIIHYILGVSR